MTRWGRRRILALLPLLPVVATAGETPLITDLSGRALRMEDFRGRPLLIDIWASWCAPCVAALPMMERLAVEFEGQGLHVLSLSIDRGGAPAALRAYHRMGITALPLHLGDPDHVAVFFAVRSLPAILLYDGTGKEVSRFAGDGAVQERPLRGAILELLRSGRAQE